MADFEYLSQPVATVDPLVKQPLPPKDLSHHFSRVTKLRSESKIKEFYKFFQIPGIGNLAGGLPNSSFFPYDTLEATVALPERWKPTPNDKNTLDTISEGLSTTALSETPPSSRVVVPHDSSSTDPATKLDLATALQYGTASGYPPLVSFIRQFTRENLHPNIPYANGAEVILTCGSTDGFAKTLECFSNAWSEERDWIREREGILVEEFTYMNAVQTAKPRGLQVVPVKMDDEGMLPTGPGSLEDVLANWDHRKGKRPHLMYLVTIGQNPTSAVQSYERRLEIYALCSKYDILLVEDEPYWYIQMPSAALHPPNSTAAKIKLKPQTFVPPPGSKSSGFEFLDSLVPSYLNIDTDGRVIRLDTFSKTVAPGCRLGWITAQPAIIERILRITESSTQQPSGFVQSLIAELIMGPQSKSASDGRGGAKNGQGWKVDGWVRWLAGLRGMYERRMNRMADILEAGKFSLKQSTPIKKEEEEWAVVSKVQMFDFDWPRAGMFLWMNIYFENHPLWGKPGAEPEVISRALWLFFTSEPYKVLLAPGAMFSPTDEILEKEGYKKFRLCFAAVDEEEVERCSEGVVEAIRAFWRFKRVEDLEGILEGFPGGKPEAKEGFVDLAALQFGC